jgi:predicted transposase/invertase (TIGR01784 family)
MITIADQLKEEGKLEGKLEGIKLGEERGKLEGSYEARIQIARTMLAKGLDKDLISQFTNLPVSEVESLKV